MAQAICMHSRMNMYDNQTRLGSLQNQSYNGKGKNHPYQTKPKTDETKKGQPTTTTQKNKIQHQPPNNQQPTNSHKIKVKEDEPSMKEVFVKPLNLPRDITISFIVC